MNGLKKSQKEM